MKRIAILVLALLVGRTAAPAAAQAPVRPVGPGTTFVIVHGAWGGAWDWKAVDRLLAARGHRVYRVTLTGLGKRSHLVSPDIGLDTHIQDVVNEIVWEGLDDVILVGHSYGGMVITGAAGRIPDRIRELVYIDALLPEPGESAADLLGGQTRSSWENTARGGLLLPVWEPAGKPIPKDTPHPLKTLLDPLRLDSVPPVPGRYILTLEAGAETDTFRPAADRASARGWPVVVMEAGHVPNRTQPLELTRYLVGEGWGNR